MLLPLAALVIALTAWPQALRAERSEEKPAGTVVIAVTTANVQAVRTYRFPVGRSRVRQFGAQMALDLARRVLLGVEPGRAFVYTPPRTGLEGATRR